MKNIILLIGAIYGFLGIILGAFGAHLFKKLLTFDKLNSFEIGVKYQMYAAFFLLIIGFYYDFQSNTERTMALFMIIGTLFFSFSIYLLSFANYWGVNLKFLGPITPIGGLLMICSWFILIFLFIKRFYYK